MLVNGVTPPTRSDCGATWVDSLSGIRPHAAARLLEVGALEELALLAGVERAHRTVVPHHAGPDLARLALVVAQGGRCAGGRLFGRDGVEHAWLHGGVGERSACGAFRRARAACARGSRCRT